MCFAQGCFLSSSTLNFHAILDTSLDIAKAMVHLHAMNVLHSDLKVCHLQLTAYLANVSTLLQV